MKKRMIAGLLCMAMLLTLLPILPMHALGNEDFVVYSGSNSVKDVTLPRYSDQTDKVSLSANGLDTEAAYQWQILVTDDLWVNIQGQTGKTIDLTYAMVASLLKDNVATVRCQAVVEGETLTTPEVTVTVDTSVPQTVTASTFSLKRSAGYTVSSDDNEPSKADLTALQEAVDEASQKLEEAKAATSAAEALSQQKSETLSAAEAALKEAQSAYDSASEEDKEAANATLEVSKKAVIDAQQELTDANTAVQNAKTAQEEAQKAYYDAVAAYDAANESEPTDTKDKYSIVINYLFTDNTIVADPYVAEIAAGTPFSATVTFPSVLGYLPYLNNEQKNSVELNYSSMDSDVTLNVFYQPTNVDYTVIHYKQNLDDDKYFEAERETKQGLTNSTVPEVAKNYEGFYALLYEKPEIAADGSTVVEVYYDRYYYLMNFDLDGGYGVEPIYARYGAPLGDVGTPTKAGYSFSGWTLDGDSLALPSTMPAENRTYKAIWKADDTAKVTVVFWGENANDEDYSYIRSMQLDAKPGDRYTFDGSSLTCPLAEHSHDKCTLNCTHTSHTLDCYSTSYGFIKTTRPNYTLTDQGNGIYTYTTTSWGRKTTHYYLNIGNDWYCGTDWWGDKDDTQKISFSCIHSHTDECYACGLIEHTHSSACSGLWTFVMSDTVTVAADGSSVVNVYYDRTEKTLTFKYNYKNRNYQSTETITAKWGSDISTDYKKIASNAGSTFWSAQTSGDGPYTNYFGVMPQTSATYYNRGTTGNSGDMTYWGQDLNGKYTVKLFTVNDVGGYYVTDEDRYEFEGFTYHHGTSNGTDCGGAEFFYTRNSYTLTFNDGYNDVRIETVKFEAPLNIYADYVPEVPNAYEPGSVVFGGWYLNPECTGAEYKLTEHKMPADNVLLYAKWVPVTHTVEFYLDQNAFDQGTKLASHPDMTVPHGSLATPTPATPENGSYNFVGWFYMEGGVEKAFDFANMPVNKDLKVYGKWSSNVLKQYFIFYKYLDAEGNEIEIADYTSGSGLAGITKTFEAKGGSELYPDYQEGYFPLTKSHSMTLDINATEENNTNVYTFWYVQKDAVPYTVKYLNKDTGVGVAPTKTVDDNRKAVVTETFVTVPGMMPDAYQKRLVVSAEEGAVNEIIFYYTEDTTHAYYKITHYTENLGTDAQGNPTWTEYASSQAVGDIGTPYTADPMTIPGFTFNENVTGTVLSGKLTADGLELKLYYTRTSYPYQVRYMEQGTGKQLADPKDGTGKFGQVIYESAIPIDGYEPVDPASQTLNIRIEESATAKLNIITFYYTEKEVTINYVVVGPAGCGTVTPTSETLKVKSGTASGSTAAASGNVYRFVGWFEDEACTTPVDASWVTDGKITPAKGQNESWTARTYYAKFEYNLTDLKIKKVASSVYEQGEKFIFDVVNADGSVSFSVTAAAGEEVIIKDVTVGDVYTITERSAWSWRYSVSSSHPQGVTISPSVENNVVTFTNTINKGLWLSGTGFHENHFSGNN